MTVKCRYVRTKENGICEVEKEDLYIISYQNPHVSGCFRKSETEYRVTYDIEVLFDEFIMFDAELDKYYIVDKSSYYVLNKKQASISYRFFLGAIWTEKGLSFAAKWNVDTEKWELL